jgi:nucleotide-binding universal stress UspA family protein
LTTTPNCIVAYVKEGEDYDSLVGESVQTALASKARLILYDADAASRFAEPLPTVWSGDQDRSLSCLSPEQLEAAGRQRLAEHVRAARALGVDAFGWLPSSRGAAALAEYVHQEGADLVIIPDDLEDRSLIERLRGDPSPEGIAQESATPTVLVHTAGHR